MSSSLSGSGGAWPVAPPSASPDLRTNRFRLRITASTSSLPETCRVFTPATSSSPSSLASASQLRGSSPSDRSEPRFPVFSAIDSFALATSDSGCS